MQMSGTMGFQWVLIFQVTPATAERGCCHVLLSILFHLSLYILIEHALDSTVICIFNSSRLILRKLCLVLCRTSMATWCRRPIPPPDHFPPWFFLYLKLPQVPSKEIWCLKMPTRMFIWVHQAQDLPSGTINCQHVQQKMERQLFYANGCKAPHDSRHSPPK